jgi:hypothetical protein
MGIRVEHPARITILPTTALGWWAVGLTAAFFPLVFTAGVVPAGAALGLICGIAGGAAAVTAIGRETDRAVLVFAALLPLVIAVAFLLAELAGAVT